MSKDEAIGVKNKTFTVTDSFVKWQDVKETKLGVFYENTCFLDMIL